MDEAKGKGSASSGANPQDEAGPSNDDAMTTDSEDNVGTAHGLKRKMMSSENLLQRSTNHSKIPKVQLPRDPSATLSPHGMFSHMADHEVA
eukprot:6637128-Karenia_brevis.AAC.1